MSFDTSAIAEIYGARGLGWSLNFWTSLVGGGSFKPELLVPSSLSKTNCFLRRGTAARRLAPLLFMISLSSYLVIPGGRYEAHVPPGALRGKTPEGKTEAHVPPGALRGKHRKRPPIQRCRALIVYVGTVCVGTRNPPEAFPTRLRRAHSLRGRTETTPR